MQQSIATQKKPKKLYIEHAFIEKHGGRLWAESEGHGHGAEFIFELPISRDGA